MLIFSNVSEGKHKPQDLERLVDPVILYSPTVQLMQIHAVTKTKMKSCLSRILRLECGRTISNDVFDEYHAMSGGDLRHAIMSLQFQIGANTSLRTSKSDPEKRKQQFERDTRLSTFHALGRILYAKRHPKSNNAAPTRANRLAKDSRPPLQFVPEKVMEESDMELSGALYFLGHNSPEFFTDISELSLALDNFSDAALLLEKKYDGSNDANFPLRYVASLAGRAVADANKNPTPNTFRQLQPPGIFEATRKRREMDLRLSLFRNRLSRNGHLSIDKSIGSSESFATHEFPSVNQILPNEVSHAFNNTVQPAQNDEENHINQDWINQLEVLAEDDIIDDSSSDGDFVRSSQHDNSALITTQGRPANKLSFHQDSSHRTTTGAEIIIID